MEKENPGSKESKMRLFASIEKDESLTAEAKRHKKDVMMMEAFLEIRDLLAVAKK